MWVPLSKSWWNFNQCTLSTTYRLIVPNSFLSSSSLTSHHLSIYSAFTHLFSINSFHPHPHIHAFNSFNSFNSSIYPFIHSISMVHSSPHNDTHTTQFPEFPISFTNNDTANNALMRNRSISFLLRILFLLLFKTLFNFFFIRSTHRLAPSHLLRGVLKEHQYHCHIILRIPLEAKFKKIRKCHFHRDRRFLDPISRPSPPTSKSLTIFTHSWGSVIASQMPSQANIK